MINLMIKLIIKPILFHQNNKLIINFSQITKQFDDQIDHQTVIWWNKITNTFDGSKYRHQICYFDDQFWSIKTNLFVILIIKWVWWSNLLFDHQIHLMAKWINLMEQNQISCPSNDQICSSNHVWWIKFDHQIHNKWSNDQFDGQKPRLMDQMNRFDYQIGLMDQITNYRSIWSSNAFVPSNNSLIIK